MQKSQYTYAFGMLMPGRQYSLANGYRFGFNGKEKDNELKGNGNSLDFGARFYDSRLGRWASPDPKGFMQPHYSPFHFSANSPISMTDNAGEENMFYIYINNKDIKLNSIQKEELKNKIISVLNRVHQANPQLEMDFGVAVVNGIIQDDDLDRTDVMIEVANQPTLFSKYPGNYTVTSPIITSGCTPVPGTGPCGVYANSLYKWVPQSHTGGYFSETEFKPNYLDILAYVAVHEAFHRVNKNYKNFFGDDHEQNGLMKPGNTTQERNIKDVITAPTNLFNVDLERINNFNDFYKTTHIDFTKFPFQSNETTQPKDNASIKAGVKVESKGQTNKNHPPLLNPCPRF